MTAVWLACELALLALAWRQIDRRLWLCVLLVLAAFVLALATVPPDPGVQP